MFCMTLDSLNFDLVFFLSFYHATSFCLLDDCTNMEFSFLNILFFLFLVQAELQLTGNNKVYAIDGSLVSVGVTYTGVDTTKRLWAVINADSDISINGTINTLHKNGSVSISSSITNSLEYGTYKITLFLLYDTGVQENVTTALFYEKNMTGLTVSILSVYYSVIW